MDSHLQESDALMAVKETINNDLDETVILLNDISFGIPEQA
jgi:hypothetical protein